MPRLARVIAPGVPHHITQRGNARRDVFDTDADRLAYLTILGQYSILYPCSLVGYCLMSNHVHLIAVPHRTDSLPALLRHTHGRYAAYLNARRGQSGHLWQGRYYSCPLDHAHLWMALRYVERNPVRAGLVALPEDHPWSSAEAHCGGADRHGLLDLDFWRAEWTAASWKDFLIDHADQDAGFSSKPNEFVAAPIPGARSARCLSSARWNGPSIAFWSHAKAAALRSAIPISLKSHSS